MTNDWHIGAGVHDVNLESLLIKQGLGTCGSGPLVRWRYERYLRLELDTEFFFVQK